MLALGVRQTGRTPLCANPIGGFVDPDSFTKAHKRLARIAGLDTTHLSQEELADVRRRTRLHDSRHAYGTQARALGVDIGDISDALGHADRGFTYRVYAHTTVGAAKRVADAIEEALGG